MKIVFLNRYQNSVERGTEVFIKELSTRLSKNHTVDIFSGVKADSIKNILKGRYDVVIPINGRTQVIKVNLARFLGGYQVLITGHSGIGWDDIWNIVLGKPNVFIALTEKSKTWAKKWAWGSRVVKIHNGIDLKKFLPEGDKIKFDLPRPVILSVGALEWYKFHEKTIEAVSKMKGTSLLIVGRGTLRDKLKKLGEEKLKDRFMLSEFQNEDMPKVYRSVNLFTLPSWDREAFGIVYLEAMASGLGVVAPDDLSRREIIGNAGEFVDVNDSLKYAQVLQNALTKNYKNIAVNQAKKYSWDIIAKKYEEIMIEMISK